MARTYPVFILLDGEPALVVGGGEVAARKVEALLDAGARVTVTAPEAVAALRALAAEGSIRLETRAYGPGEAAGYVVTVAATNDMETNRAVAADARAAGRLVNVVDQPELCNFIVPSVIRRGDLTIAISTGGGSPALSRMLRERLEADFPERMGVLLDELAGFRARLRRTVSDEAERKRILTDAVNSEYIAAFLDGNEAPLKEYLARWT